MRVISNLLQLAFGLQVLCVPSLDDLAKLEKEVNASRRSTAGRAKAVKPFVLGSQDCVCLRRIQDMNDESQ